MCVFDATAVEKGKTKGELITQEGAENMFEVLKSDVYQYETKSKRK